MSTPGTAAGPAGGGSSRDLRVVWLPGTDELLGVCYCGAEQVSTDPIELWTWLHGHPLGHDTSGSPTQDPSLSIDDNRSMVPRPVGIGT